MIFFLYPKAHSLSKLIFFRIMMAISAHRAKGIIAVSDSTSRDVRDLLKVKPDKIHAIPEAAGSNYRLIDDRAAVSRICKKYGLSAGKFVLYVGVLEPRKNIPILLQAYQKLVNRGIDKKLVIVGKKGWMYHEIFSTVKILKMENNVVFPGYVPEEDLPYLYNGASLFVYPSLYEGFGLPVLEAMSCGVAVVTSNVSSMPEISGDSALLVDPQDPEQLAKAMERVLTDNVLNNSLKERGLQRAGKFSWERTALETLRVYEEVYKR
jgi:glycosyltransferase involved in cell wall biosynthesis